MDEKLAYLEERSKREPKFTYEIIVVSDGSKDGTEKVTLGYSERYGTDKVRLLKLARNRGKGGAVVQGMIRARGKLVIFADADGATQVADVKKLEDKLAVIQKDGLGIAVGSRHHLVDTDVVVKVFVHLPFSLFFPFSNASLLVFFFFLSLFFSFRFFLTTEVNDSQFIDGFLSHPGVHPRGEAHQGYPMWLQVVH